MCRHGFLSVRIWEDALALQFVCLKSAAAVVLKKTTINGITELCKFWRVNDRLAQTWAGPSVAYGFEHQVMGTLWNFFCHGVSLLARVHRCWEELYRTFDTVSFCSLQSFFCSVAPDKPLPSVC